MNLVEAVDSVWPRWDTNKDHRLDRREIVAVLRSPKTRGPEASLAATLYQTKFAGAAADKPFAVSRDELLALASNAGFRKNVQKGQTRLANTSRTLFADGDPSLAGFHQGREGDCYLLSNIALLVTHRPEQLRSMLTVLGNGDIRLTLGNGQAATISPLTDAEILLGADPGPGSGMWLPAFEKAYGVIRSKTEAKNPARNALRHDEAMFSLVNAGGFAVPTLQELTGHKVIGDAVIFGKETKEQAAKREQVHTLLTKLMKEKRLVLLHTRRNPDKGSTFVKPPGWPDAHTYALFGYDAEKRVAHCFNPWGNSFKPKGASSLQNGYPTEGGEFDMPLDEFMALFKSMSYETAQPVAMVSK